MTGQNRREADRFSSDIEEMISNEPDQRQRAQLMVLYNINLSLMANTRTIQDVKLDFDEHRTAYEERTAREAALMNRGIGAWKVIAWVLGLAQAVLLAGAGYVANDLREIHVYMQEGRTVNSLIEIRLKQLERHLP